MNTALTQVAFVTGASSGMGKETALRLLDKGLIVYVAARRLELMTDLQERGAIAIQMDISKEEQIVAAIQKVEAAHGGIDVLINNAGFGMYGSMEESSIADARYQFEVNLFGLARLTQLALPYMRQKGAGTIVNISSMGGKMYTPLGSWYHATKHALEGWSDCLRIELASFGIKVIELHAFERGHDLVCVCGACGLDGFQVIRCSRVVSCLQARWHALVLGKKALGKLARGVVLVPIPAVG